MVDPKKQAARLGAEAMLEAGKDAARKLYDDLTLTDEEKKRREAARLAEAKRKRQKWIAIAVASLVALVVVMALVASYWPYILGLTVLGVLGYLGFLRVRGALGKKDEAEADARRDDPEETKREKRRQKPRPKELDEGEPAEALEVPRTKVRVEPLEDPAVLAAKAAAKSAERDRRIEDELADLKKRAGK